VPSNSLDHRPPVQPVDEAPGHPGSSIFPELPSPHAWVTPCLRGAAFPAAHLRVAPQLKVFIRGDKKDLSEGPSAEH